MMKNILRQSWGALALAFVLLGGGQAQAALVYYEDFNYSAGNLGTQNGGTGFTAAWTPSLSSSTPEATMVVVSPGLSYSTLSVSGNTANDNSSSTREGDTRAFSGAGLFGNGTELWFSALVNTSAALGSDMKILALSNTDPGNNGGFGFDVNGTTITSQIGTATSAGTLTGTSGATMLIVSRLTFSSTAGADTITTWLNPAFGITPTTGGVSISGDINTALTQLGIRGGSAWTGSVDEIRLGNTFDDVTPVPEPSTFALMGVGLGALWMLRRRKSA